MSIEGISVAPSGKTVTGTAGHSGAGKATSCDAADALAAGGFLALLTSLEPEVAADGVGAGADDSIETDPSRVSIDEVPKMMALPMAASVAHDLPNDLAMLLAQAGQVAVDKLSTFSDQQLAGAKEGLRLAATAIEAEDTPHMMALATAASVASVAHDLPDDLARLLAPAGQVAVDKLGTFSDQQLARANEGLRLAATAIGTDKPGLALAAETSADLTRHVDALLERTAQSLHARTLKASGAERQSVAGAVLAEVRALNQSFVADVAAREPALSGALLASGLGESFLRPGDRVATKSFFMVAASGIEGIWGQQSLQSGGRVDTPLTMPGSSALSLESMVADKVRYWVTQGVQNAELKLDGFGGEPVEVSISLKGSEAHIDFRTDQPEIRQILEGAVAHLKDLLKSEGLVLSGVSVGTSGQDGTGAQERRQQPGARQVSITAAEAGPTDNPQRVNQAAGRAVDIFV